MNKHLIGILTTVSIDEPGGACRALIICDTDKLNKVERIPFYREVTIIETAELARLLEALQGIARQKLSFELETEGCFQTGYDECIRHARSALP